MSNPAPCKSLRRAATLLACCCLAVAATAQEPVDWRAVERIRAEGLGNSQVMATLQHLTDEIGPRLTGSPQMKEANEAIEVINRYRQQINQRLVDLQGQIQSAPESSSAPGITPTPSTE